MRAACALWGTTAQDLESHRDGAAFDSPRAGGKYFITGTAISSLGSVTDQERALITTHLVNQRSLGVAMPELSSDDIERLARSRPLPVHERADRLLAFFSAQSEHLGERISYDYSESTGLEMLATSESTDVEEIDFLLAYLRDVGFCEVEQFIGGAGDVSITVRGYERLAELSAVGARSEQAFVAMWFDTSVEVAFTDGIAKGIEDAGYTPMRIDQKDHNNKIDDEIIAEIKRSRFLVADFTQGDAGARGGVYYEAGYAHGIGIPVIFTCREDMIGKAHFDTRQYSHILWSTPADLRSKLANRISATVGDGPLRRSPRK